MIITETRSVPVRHTVLLHNVKPSCLSTRAPTGYLPPVFPAHKADACIPPTRTSHTIRWSTKRRLSMEVSVRPSIQRCGSHCLI